MLFAVGPGYAMHHSTCELEIEMFQPAQAVDWQNFVFGLQYDRLTTIGRPNIRKTSDGVGGRSECVVSQMEPARVDHIHWPGCQGR